MTTALNTQWFQERLGTETTPAEADAFARNLAELDITPDTNEDDFFGLGTETAFCEAINLAVHEATSRESVLQWVRDNIEASDAIETAVGALQTLEGTPNNDGTEDGLSAECMLVFNAACLALFELGELAASRFGRDAVEVYDDGNVFSVEIHRAPGYQSVDVISQFVGNGYTSESGINYLY